jgi:phospholipase C
VDTNLPAAVGTHRLVVRAWDSSTTYFQAVINFTISSGGGGGGSCTPSTADRTVTICSPGANSTVTSPFTLSAVTTSSKPVTKIENFLDGKNVFTVAAKSENTQLSAATGTHRLVVRAWDSSTTYFQTVINFTVSTSGGGGGGTSPLTFSSTSLAFGDQIVGTTSIAKRVTVTNVSGSAVPISSIQIFGAEFSQLQNCGVQLPAGRSCEINVRFDPETGGQHSANLQISYSGTGSPANIALSANGLAQAKPPIPINHIIWVMQENRGFDNYFGKMNDYRASLGLPAEVDGIPAGGFSNKDDGGRTVNTFHMLTTCIEAMTPSWNESHHDVNWHNASADIGLNDGFVNQAAGFARPNGFFDLRGVRTMGYYTSADLPYYYFMATQFAMSDRYFSPLPANTPPNRLYALGGSSFGTTKSPTTTFSQPNIFQRLEDAGISWKIYYTDTDSSGLGLSRIWSFQPWASQHKSKIVPISVYKTDLANGTLPQVALIESGYGSGRDEHPGGTVNGSPTSGTRIGVGAAYIASLINPLLTSSSWKDSVFIFTFDEGGGTYDHVVPPFNAVPPDDIAPSDLSSSSVPDGFDRYGFRLPFFLVSPYAKRHYVSHTPADHTAILRFIEERFNLPPLTRRDAAQPDMREFFNFANPNFTLPANIPAQPTSGACNYTNIPE